MKMALSYEARRRYAKPKWTEGLTLTPEEEAEALRINNEMLEAQVKAAEQEAEERKLQAAADKKYYADLARQRRIESWLLTIQAVLWWGGWIVGVASVIAAFIAIYAVADYAWSSKQCQVYTEISNERTAYSWFTGCMVEIRPGKWITMEAAATRSNEVTLRGDK
jgi:cobalamin biosynthesis Mg chelatase CobN